MRNVIEWLAHRERGSRVNNNKNIFYFLWVLLALSLFPATLSWAELHKSLKEGSFLTLSDIHFNPFYTCDSRTSQCVLIDKLRQAPAVQWHQILASGDTRTQVYGKNTGYQLFASGLIKLKQEASQRHVKFVLMLGDFLAHDYQKQYQQYTHDTSTEGYRLFVDKTMLFMMGEIADALPNSDVFPVVGNNDTYSEHYTSEPVFYKQMAPIWAQTIHDASAQAQMQRNFVKGGYYAVDIATQSSLRLLVLNSTLVSSSASGTKQQAKTQYLWLQQQLRALAKHQQKAIIAIHIPPSVDVYATIEQGKAIPLWNKDDSRLFLRAMQSHSPQIVAILSGHLHADWFQLKRDALGKNVIPITSTPAISPLFGNNPAFKLYQYDATILQLRNYQTLYYPLDDKEKRWQIEYDFNQVYQPFCQQCQLVVGMKLLKPNGPLAERYKWFYAVSRNAQPITKENKWLPYYWCFINYIDSNDYKNCLDSFSTI